MLHCTKVAMHCAADIVCSIEHELWPGGGMGVGAGGGVGCVVRGSELHLADGGKIDLVCAGLSAYSGEPCVRV